MCVNFLLARRRVMVVGSLVGAWMLRESASPMKEPQQMKGKEKKKKKNTPIEREFRDANHVLGDGNP